MPQLHFSIHVKHGHAVHSGSKLLESKVVTIAAHAGAVYIFHSLCPQVWKGTPENSTQRQWSRNP